MAVEHAKAPCGGDEQTGSREQNAHEENGKFALFAVKAGSDGIDQPGRSEDAEKHDNGSAETKQCRDSASGFASFLFVASSKELGINRDERGGEHAFAKKILQEIGDPEGSFENVRGVGIAEIVGEDAIADQSGYAA
jgi:hypothetical protein